MQGGLKKPGKFGVEVLLEVSSGFVPQYEIFTV